MFFEIWGRLELMGGQWSCQASSVRWKHLNPLSTNKRRPNLYLHFWGCYGIRKWARLRSSCLIGARITRGLDKKEVTGKFTETQNRMVECW